MRTRRPRSARRGLRLRLRAGLGLRGLERRARAFEGAQLLAQRPDVVGRRRAQLVEGADHAARGADEIVGELLRALARDPGLAGRGLEGLHRRAAYGVGPAGGTLVVLLCHRPEPIRRALSSGALAPATIHVHPTAALADRALLPGDPGRALALAQALFEGAPKMF